MAKRFKMPAPKKGKPAKSKIRGNGSIVKRAAKGSKPGKARRPRQGVLPGHEQVRNERLDALCEEIGDAREVMNKGRAAEGEALGDALSEMHRAGVTVYRHAKIELARIPGGEKIRARTLKETGRASDADQVSGEPEASEEGAGAFDTAGV